MGKKKINLDKEKKVVSEFKEFISKGNIVDMAVGVIIGSAFGKIVTSLVNDIFMPLIGVIIGGLDFTSLTIKVGDAVINYGVFIQNIVDFLIIAGCIFLMIKILAKFKKKEEVKEEKPIVKEDENTVLLREIRDLLKKNK
ncbi:MAG: large-conductance mechanosensitive channel protein MscL [Bacilli bacterium]